MRRRSAIRILGVLVLAVLAPNGYPCTWARGYFHRVGRLRGKVVGVSYGDWRRYLRWLRQRASKANARLVLHEYRDPIAGWAEGPVVKAVTTNKNGEFDFGVLPKGHYTLDIGGEDYFDVEIVLSTNQRKHVVIDVSPVHPDCTGGHEFLLVDD